MRPSHATLGLLFTACSGPQSMLEPAGPGAAAIAGSWWLLLSIMTAVLVAVMAALVHALFRRRTPSADDNGVERRRVVAVLVAGAAVPFVILVAIFIHTLMVLTAVGPSREGGDLVVDVVGHQYWWEVRYPLPGGDTVVSANEIHVPVGAHVALSLRSADVIHSLWVPKLHGKTDMIPGRTNRAWIVADEPGVYRGQCAEYCGQQHAWMALYVVARPEPEFRAWLMHQRRPAAPVAPAPDPAGEAMMEPGPAVPDSVRTAALDRNARIRRGRAVFLDPVNRCAECHVIRGETDVAGRERRGAPGEPPGRTAEGPDLTHVASRRTLAAGLLTTNRGNMGGWISNPQALKPGNLMPHIPLEPEDMNALLEYLMSLR